MFRFSPRRNRADQVHWRAWGEDAFREAQQRDKPIALFITAFWCGFCQRMDETTLSNEDVIAVLNGLFVPIRVEESQRPDIDIRYNQDGWPTIVLLTPWGDRLLTVNFMAPIPFLNVLAQVIDYYEKHRAALRAAAAQAGAVPAPRSGGPAPEPLDMAIVGEIAGMIEGLADRTYGGYGDAIKLFHTEANEFLLSLYEATGDRAFLDHVVLTLDRMRASKTYDAVGGGFYRYSSKRDWQEPHPEKLLDDQASLLGLYLHAWLLTEQPAYRATAEALVDYLDSTLFDSRRGVFYGCQDYVRLPGSASAGPTPDASGMLSLLDEYVYCDANARAASSYFLAWWLLGREQCRVRAEGILAWLWEHLRAPDGGMYHYHDGAPHTPHLLNDTVMTGLALLDAYQFTQDTTALARAQQLAADIVRLHRNPDGGFYDIVETGPAALRYPLTALAENARAARFFVRLADLTGDAAYRRVAQWALRSFPGAHRAYGAFAAGFGHALALYLTPPLAADLTATPGDPQARRLLRAATTQLGYQNVVVTYRAGRQADAALVLRLNGRATGPMTDPTTLRPEVVRALAQQ